MRRASTIIATLPTATELAGNFAGFPPVKDPLTGQPFSGNLVPSERFSSLTKRILPLLPEPAVGGVNNFRVAPSTKDDIDQFTIRLDHRFGEKDSLFARYTMQDTRLYLPGLTKLSAEDIPDRAQNTGVQWTHAFSPGLLNEARVGFMRFFHQTIQEGAFGEDILKFQNAVEAPIAFGLPFIGITGYT
jgi:hypothetical protein